MLFKSRTLALFIHLANGPFEIINIDGWGISLHSSSFCHKYCHI